ncbi:MAG: S8 family serine peptidase [Salinibacterium sp.]|nr:S8 family serine peptidase [Salinibacterium sp.]
MALVAAIALAPTAASADAVRDQQYWLDAYGIRAAWTVTQGAGVTIAIIDTGVDGSVRDLSGVVVGGADFSGLGAPNGQRPVGSEGSEHGTMVASLAAGRGTGPGAGVIGSAPAASVLALSVGFGEGEVASDDQIAKAVRFAVDNGANIINMSLTRNTLEWPQSWDDAFLYAMQNDVVVVAAAGNRGSGTTVVGAPATMPGVLTVAGVDAAGSASFDASSQGITIAISAPSEDLVGVVPGGGYVRWNGTSGATPIVAGVAAMVMAAHPELDAANVINRIVSTARDAGAAGPDPIYGFGLIDAYAAVTAAVSPVTANPMGELSEWITLYRRADAAPEPISSPPAATIPTPSPAPIAAQPQNPLGAILPTVNLLRNVGLPVGVVALFGAAVLWLGVSGFSRLRSARATAQRNSTTAGDPTTARNSE